MKETLEKLKASLSPLQQRAKDLIAKIEEQFGRTKSVIGIDVGAGAVKVVQMADLDGKWAITKTALVDIGGQAGSQEEVLASLKTALIGFDLEGAKVVAIVNCPQTCTRKIIMPHMPKKELAQAVPWEAKNAIPFSLEEALLDFEILDEIADKNARKMIVAVSASPKQTVNRLVTLFSKAGLEPAAIIPISISQQNLFALSDSPSDEIVAVVEMGAALTELNIYRGGRMAFSRKLPVAGNDITKALTSTLMSAQGKVELSVEEAEKIKREHGIPSGEGAGLLDGKILPSQVLSLVRPCVEQLAAEIERSFDFFREESRGGQVGRVVLYGGGANLKGLIAALKKELDVDIEVGNAFEHAEALPKAVAPRPDAGSRFNLALGAALGREETMNLLPVEIKEKTRRFIEKVSLKGVAVAIVVSLFLFYAGLHVQFHGLNNKLEALKLEERTLEPQLETLRARILLDGVLKDQPYWEDVLMEVSHLVPPEIVLSRLKAEGATVTFHGDILSSERNSPEVLSGFMLRLEEGIFKNVSLVMTRERTTGASAAEFQITCTVE